MTTVDDMANPGILEVAWQVPPTIRPEICRRPSTIADLGWCRCTANRLLRLLLLRLLLSWGFCAWRSLLSCSSLSRSWRHLLSGSSLLTIARICSRLSVARVAVVVVGTIALRIARIIRSRLQSRSSLRSLKLCSTPEGLQPSPTLCRIPSLSPDDQTTIRSPLLCSAPRSPYWTEGRSTAL